jgi:hypothetical protein
MNIKISNLTTDTNIITVADYFNTNISNIDTINSYITIRDSIIQTSTISLEPVIVDIISSNEVNDIKTSLI